MPTSLLLLGDQAILAYFRDESAALRFTAAVRRTNDPWLVDVVQAYTSVAVFFDLQQITFAQVAERLTSIGLNDAASGSVVSSRLHRIPCCYDFQLDMARVVEHTGQPAGEIIRLHTEAEYTIYAIGFCPGFPYLGYLPAALRGVPRLSKPRLRVEVGSVGLAGRQTGIYTEVRPGGWNILGRTPLQLVDVSDGYFPMRTGDRIRFEPIDEAEYRRLLGKRLNQE